MDPFISLIFFLFVHRTSCDDVSDSGFWEFPPSFGSFNLAKQFKRRFLEIHQSETRLACGCHVC
jgi:hypothetical protein